MGLAGEHELGAGGEGFFEGFGVAQQQRRSLVGGEAPGEADDAAVGIELDAGARGDAVDQHAAGLTADAGPSSAASRASTFDHAASSPSAQAVPSTSS